MNISVHRWSRSACWVLWRTCTRAAPCWTRKLVARYREKMLLYSFPHPRCQPLNSRFTRTTQAILVPRSSVSFGHVVGKTEALVSAVTGCPKIPDIHSLIRVVHSFFISQWKNSIFSLRPGLLVSGAKKKTRGALGTRMDASIPGPE